MKLIFHTAISSSDWGSYGNGEIGEVPDAEAKNLIAAKYASPIQEEEKQIETTEAKRPSLRKAVKR